MVKPQPPFRQAASPQPNGSEDNGDADDDADDDANDNASINSYSMRVADQCPIFPDFAICQHTGSLTGDTLHIVIEVKSRVAQLDISNIQLGRYLNSQGTVGRDAMGMSIAGGIVQVFFMAGSGGHDRLDQEFGLNDTAFIDFLVEYAATH